MFVFLSMSIYRAVEISTHCFRTENMCMMNITFRMILTTKYSPCVGDWLDLTAALEMAVRRNVRAFWPREEPVPVSVTLHGSQLCAILQIELETWFSVAVIVVCSKIYVNIYVLRLPQESICAYWFPRPIIYTFIWLD